jgi:hypothetical protein
MRVGLSAYLKTDAKLMDIRRITGAQNILHQELEGFIPALAACGGSNMYNGFKAAFFQGEMNAMRMVSSFSLGQGWRGMPMILEFTTIPGEEGVKLVVNEIPYGGHLSTAAVCPGLKPSPSGDMLPSFIPVVPGPKAFVLADQLSYCRFWFYGPGKTANDPPVWTEHWDQKGWPYGIRVEMAPAKMDPSRVHPITVTAPIRIRRDPQMKYEDAS